MTDKTNNQGSTSWSIWLNPRHWLLGTGLLLWRLVSYFPSGFYPPLAHGLGLLMRKIKKSRVELVRRNLELVAPDMPSEQRKDILDGVYDSLGMMPFETAMAWFSSPDKLSRKAHFTGLELLQKELQEGRGVLLLSPHFTHLDLTAAMLGKHVSIDGVYRPHKTPVFDAFVKKRRERFLENLLSRDDMRGAVRALRQGRVLWYAPDHDYRHKMSVFAPFFGIQASTIVAPARLVKMTKCAVFVLAARREENEYHISLQGPVEGLPSGSPEQDAGIINAALEHAISQAMDQYMWVHRRFKTRPEGEGSLYE